MEMCSFLGHSVHLNTSSESQLVIEQQIKSKVRLSEKSERDLPTNGRENDL